MKRKLGRFKLDMELVALHPKQALSVMQKVIVVRAEMMYESNCIEYTAMSEEFEGIEIGCMAPWYTVEIEAIITESDDGEITTYSAKFT